MTGRWVWQRHHILAIIGGAFLVAWAIGVTAFMAVDMVTGNPAQRVDQSRAVFQERIASLAADRDAQRQAALQAQDRYTAAIDHVADFQDKLFDAKEQIARLEQDGMALRRLLSSAIGERDAATDRLVAAQGADAAGQSLAQIDTQRATTGKTVDLLTTTLGRVAEERDAATETANMAQDRVAELEYQAQLDAETNDQIFGQLENAVSMAMTPLRKVFADVGLPPDQVLRRMRERYSGEGGPLLPVAISTKNSPDSPERARANRVMTEMDALNLYRMAGEKVPFALPSDRSMRITSPFGIRRHPITGRTRMHEGTDFAGDRGQSILATADGIVSYAGWMSGYGRIVKIKHAFGIETAYAHMASITVKKGQRVSKGDKVGGMGSSGRSTGTHLHYEILVADEPINPMRYIEAARDVF